MKCIYCGKELSYKAEKFGLFTVICFASCDSGFHTYKIGSGVAFTLKRAKRRAEKEFMSNYFLSERVNRIE